MRQAAICSLLFLLLSCASSPRDAPIDPSLFPLREVRLSVLVDTHTDANEVRRAIRSASVLLAHEAGIALTIVRLRPIDFGKHANDEELRERTFAELIVERKTSDTHPNYDIGFVYAPAAGTRLERISTGTAVGYMRNWREILVRELSDEVIAHEVIHGFLRICGHSKNGLMAAPIQGTRLAPEDRQLVQKNKWIDFSGGPTSVADPKTGKLPTVRRCN